MNETYILKQRLQELIGDATVEAALFYTFNFDPRFFENYVMPLLVHEQSFSNNVIVNNIIWRTLYKDNRVPPIKVYCDQYAKSLDAGPMLAYDIVEVNMNSIGKNKGNFHPKNSFILLRKDNQQSLIVITGSNNITQGGWCENKECISEFVLISEVFLPMDIKKDLASFIREVIEMSASNETYVEQNILSFLNKRATFNNWKNVFYHSFIGDFKKFLASNVLELETITHVEVLSPYCYNDTSLVQFFLDNGIKVKLQVPMRNSYCSIEEEVYNKYLTAGGKWYYPIVENNVNDIRFDHSKVYRFYGQSSVYTFIGSVNFTAPAWSGVTTGKKVYNIESGLLYTERADKQEPLLKKPVNGLLEFLPISENVDENPFERINAPSIDFIINWSEATISWKVKTKTNCFLVLAGGFKTQLANKGSINILELANGSDVLKALSRKTIMEVIEVVNNEERTHYYYPNQEGFEQKPLEYRLSSTDIIDVWEMLGEPDETIKEWLVYRLEQFTSTAQDESGVIVQSVSEHKSLINEMSRHLYGLIRLEEYLFATTQFRTNKERLAQGKRLQYFLTHDNVDTLPSYIKDIEELYAQGSLLPGYYWLLLSIILSNIYEHPNQRKLIKECIEETDRKQYKRVREKQIEYLQEKMAKVEVGLKVNKSKLNWVVENLSSYASTRS